MLGRALGDWAGLEVLVLKEVETPMDTRELALIVEEDTNAEREAFALETVGDALEDNTMLLVDEPKLLDESFELERSVADETEDESLTEDATELTPDGDDVRHEGISTIEPDPTKYALW
jgi:hypothetical protein